MLASFVVYLRPHNPAPLGRSAGRSMHALLLNMISQVDPDLSAALHGMNTLKPFTVSMLQGRFIDHEGRPFAVPTETYRVRYTVLEERIFAALGHVLLGKQLYNEPVIIDGEPFAIEEIVVSPERAQGWAQLATYDQLLDSASTNRQIGLQFASPTTFKQGDANLLFPLPVSVFGSYLRKWEAFCAIPLPAGILDFVETYVVAEKYELATRLVHYGEFDFHGFTGTCTYRVLRRDDQMTRTLHALASFALFAGTGQKTPQGMGQTRTRPGL